MKNFTTPAEATAALDLTYSLPLEANTNVTVSYMNIVNISVLPANVTAALGSTSGDGGGLPGSNDLVATVVTVLCITVTVVFGISLMFLALEKHRQTGKRRAENFSSHSRRYALEVGQLRRDLEKDKKCGKSDDEETDDDDDNDGDEVSESSPSLNAKRISAPKITVTNATPERKQKDFNLPLLSVSQPCDLNEDDSDIEMTGREVAARCSSSSIALNSSVDSLFTGGDNSSSDFGQPSSSSMQRTGSIRSDSFLQTAHYPHRHNANADSVETVQSGV